jgi:cell wall-associated NlpC family hydrolase
LYFKPGVHDACRDFKVYPGKVNYIPGDAIFYGNINNKGVPQGIYTQNGENIKQTFDTAESLYKFINEWWRTPYRYGGSSKRGIDCSAFTQSLYKKVYDVNIPRVASQQYKVGKTIQRTEAKTGDLVFFRSAGPSGWHVGV